MVRLGSPDVRVHDWGERQSPVGRHGDLAGLSSRADVATDLAEGEPHCGQCRPMSAKLRYLYRAYRYRYRVDPAELRFVRDCLRPGHVAVDVGCHKGAYTYWMRRCVGPSGAVFAFEPQPRQVAYLQQLFDTMSYGNVTLVPMALSDRVGRLPLHVPSGNGRTHLATLEARSEERGARSEMDHEIASDSRSSLLTSRTCVVQVTTLDAFFADRRRGPDFLKIDVEGHETAVLAGGRKTLERFKPAVLIECEARHRSDGDVGAVFEFLLSLGYVGTFFHNGGRQPLTRFDASVHQRIDPQSQELPRDYANNFAFVHARGSRA
jgi:FkbM family methyltransferase